METVGAPHPAGAGAAAAVRSRVRDVADFPTAGVVYKDITPLLADPAAFAATVDALVDSVAVLTDRPVDKVVGIEARGFILAAPVALRLGAGFVPVRKPGKLSSAVERIDYTLEYRTDTLEVHTDALAPGERVLIVDDVLATGGTALAAASLVERLGGEVVGLACVLELAFLGGRARIGAIDTVALATY